MDLFFSNRSQTHKKRKKTEREICLVLMKKRDWFDLKFNSLLRLHHLRDAMDEPLNQCVWTEKCLCFFSLVWKREKGKTSNWQRRRVEELSIIEIEIEREREKKRAEVLRKIMMIRLYDTESHCLVLVLLIIIIIIIPSMKRIMRQPVERNDRVGGWKRRSDD